MCKCKDTFIWNPVTGECECPEESHLAWRIDSREQLCIPKGRCLQDQHCVAQASGTGGCRIFGENAFTQWKWCLCNYGYVKLLITLYFFFLKSFINHSRY